MQENMTAGVLIARDTIRPLRPFRLNHADLRQEATPPSTLDPHTHKTHSGLVTARFQQDTLLPSDGTFSTIPGARGSRQTDRCLAHSVLHHGP